jgi:hypothetical protein
MCSKACRQHHITEIEVQQVLSSGITIVHKASMHSTAHCSENLRTSRVAAQQVLAAVLVHLGQRRGAQAGWQVDEAGTARTGEAVLLWCVIRQAAAGMRMSEISATECGVCM